MGAVRTAIYPADQRFDEAMNDLLVIGMTIVIFAAFFLLVKVVERLER
jgi:hypothetical protein